MDHAPRSLWLPFLREAAPAASTPEEAAAAELREGLKHLAPGSPLPAGGGGRLRAAGGAEAPRPRQRLPPGAHGQPWP